MRCGVGSQGKTTGRRRGRIITAPIGVPRCFDLSPPTSVSCSLKQASRPGSKTGVLSGGIRLSQEFCSASGLARIRIGECVAFVAWNTFRTLEPKYLACTLAVLEARSLMLYLHPKLSFQDLDRFSCRRCSVSHAPEPVEQLSATTCCLSATGMHFSDASTTTPRSPASSFGCCTKKRR